MIILMKLLMNFDTLSHSEPSRSNLPALRKHIRWEASLVDCSRSVVYQTYSRLNGIASSASMVDLNTGKQSF